MPIILATLEMEIRRITVQVQHRQKKFMKPHLNHWLDMVVWCARVTPAIQGSTAGLGIKWDPILKIANAKRAGRVTQVVKSLPSKWKALSLTPSTGKKKILIWGPVLGKPSPQKGFVVFPCEKCPHGVECWHWIKGCSRLTAFIQPLLCSHHGEEAKTKDTVTRKRLWERQDAHPEQQNPHRDKWVEQLASNPSSVMSQLCAPVKLLDFSFCLNSLIKLPLNILG
jgi:hypothetical protein